MFHACRSKQFQDYGKAKAFFTSSPDKLIALEKLISDHVFDVLTSNIEDIRSDYDEASFLYPFWEAYPPKDRGRQPKGDQYPWIEVGEHIICTKLPRLLDRMFLLRDCGLPGGSDLRLVLSGDDIADVMDGYTNSCWLFADVKSVGPRDDQEHAVMSHNQISGDGNWDNEPDGVSNTPIIATGARTTHPFHCAIPPIYVLSDGTVLPVVSVAIKPVYKMLSMDASMGENGQPLERIVLITIPNGLLLKTNPNYLSTYPALFYPGKDDKKKNPLKVRARVDFEILSRIDPWRVRTIRPNTR